MSSITPGDWFAVGQLFGGPFTFKKTGGETPSAQKFDVGVQILSVMDVVSSYILGGCPIAKPPSPYTADEILAFLRPTFEKHGLPRIGIVLSKSVWFSSAEMFADALLIERAAMLKSLDISFGPMARSEKEALAVVLKRLNLRLVFDESQIDQVSLN